MRSFASCLLLLFAVSLQAAEPPKSPLSPEESLKHFVLGDPNLQIEIVAAEPEVIDPVAIQFDEHGRLWVVELSDYPNGPEPGKPPMSRIKLLEDKDGDGRYETAHIFADKLLFATGVQPWDGGVIVTLAGEVAYFKDTDGDHKADFREIWFTGFAQANPQLRANHPTFGPDGWIYVANGLRGGDVIAMKKDWPVKVEGGTRRQGDKEKNKTESPSSPSPLVPVSPRPAPQGVSHDPANPVPVSLTGRDFKFDPLTGRYEAISGNGQFGMTFDAWGNRFVCDNRHPCRHVIFEEDFIKRCPHVAFPAVVHDVIPADDKNRVFPLTSAWTTSNLHAGTFTASCGVTVYTGDWLPEEFRGNVFVCEPTGNLVQRAILEPDGVTFKSRNPYERSRHVPRDEPSTRDSRTTSSGDSKLNSERLVTRNVTATETQEFLASRDDWFRPVDLQNGPDGALYVVDMYRAVIEHPEWVPDELKKRPDTWLGNDKGRIYRIRPSSPATPRQEQPSARSTSEKQSTSTARSADLSRSDRATFGKSIVSVANLDASFNSSNGWHRMAASRIVHESSFGKTNIALPDLRPDTTESKVLARQSKTLESVTGSIEQFFAWMSDDPRLRRAALESTSKSWRARNSKLSNREREWLQTFLTDDDVRVRFSALQSITIGEKFDIRLPYAITFCVIDDPTNVWTRLAAIGAVEQAPAPLLHVVIEHFVRPNQRLAAASRNDLLGIAAFTELLGEQIVSRPVGNDPSVSVVKAIAMERNSNGKPESFLVAGSSVLGIAKGLARKGQTLEGNLERLAPNEHQLVDQFFARAADLLNANEQQQRLPLVEMAIRLLRHGPFDAAKLSLRKAAEAMPDQTVRVTAVESFSSFQKPEVDAWLIDRYRSETPAIRRAILAALFASKERQLRLLEAIEQGQIAATELGPVQANQLTQSKDETVRERAKTILAAAAPASRKEVLDAYQPALSLKADPKRGRELFVKNCSTCHRVDNVGVNVAPDISDTRTKKPEQLLLDIVDPNKAIDANYFAYAVALKDGTVQSGVISAETATSITLKQPEGKVLTLLRSDIEELRNTGLSLMPVGLEKNVDQQAMADLIFWLKNWRYLDGKVPATSLGGK